MIKPRFSGNMKSLFKLFLSIFLIALFNSLPSFGMEHQKTQDRAELDDRLTAFYKKYLDREPGASELAHYKLRHEKNRSMEEISKEIANSPEARIRNFYRLYLIRKPDDAGLTHYLSQYSQGRSLGDIEQEISCSEESREQASKSQTTQFKRDKTIISVGWRCTARFNIIAHYYGEEQKGPTNFFDWIFSASFEEVIHVLDLTSEEFKKTFRLENLDIHLAGNGHYGIRPKNLRHITSIHDVEVGDEANGPDTTEKRQTLNRKLKDHYIDIYTRRYSRLIERIKEQKPIFFIRWSEDIQNNTSTELTEDQVTRFHAVLEKISPGNKHYLINVGSRLNPLLNVELLESRYRFKYFDLSQFPKISLGPKLDWTFDDHDWLKVFSWIESIK